MDENKPTQGEKPKARQTQKKTEAQAEPVAPRVVMRGERKMLHHLFASSVTDCKKNVSYQPKSPKLEDMPHKHFFHSVDNRGRRLTTCSMSNGHFHEVSWSVDPATGELIAKSGPALRKETIPYEDGSHEVVDAPVGWADKKGKVHYDTHTHEWEYVQSEEFTAKDIDALRQSNKEGLAATGVTADQLKPMQAARPMTHEDGITIREG